MECKPAFIKRAQLAVCAGIFATAFSALAPSAAHADMKVCNDTKSITGIAIGYRVQKNWVMEGWLHVPEGVCATVIEGELKSRYFYIYAEDADTGGQWRGPVFMCTSAREFRIEGLKDCFARGYERTGFFEVDTGNQANWQVRLTPKNQSGQEEKTAK